MKSPFLRLGPVAVLVVLGFLASIATFTFVHADQNTIPASWAGNDAVTASSSLHNPDFDNGYWYYFHERYDSSYPPGALIPAGNDINDTQDWRLWFLNGTDIVDCDPDDTAHSGDESVKIRAFSDSGRQVAGLYQVITGVDPCHSYKFTMHGYSRQKEDADWLADLKVGIEPTGWHPDSENDPAVHNWPSTMVWGTSHTEYTDDFGRLEVTAEALDDEIVVFLYADARGGVSHKIHWDTGSFQSVAWSGDLLDDPDNRVVNTGGFVGTPSYTAGPTMVTVVWHTDPADTMNQVYYRRVSSESTTPPGTLLAHVIYLPLVNRSEGSWQWTEVDEGSENPHSISIMGLQPDTTYEYFVVSRGYSGTSCELWVSNVQEFTTQ
ncbi:MAG: hypothetical protein GY832_07970 [Chloroflexi bacterium]|nr:hypothetical protein [Chloroflexota bacterium]